jgi:hypothetical protein
MKEPTMKNIAWITFLSSIGFVISACSDGDDSQERSGVAENTAISSLNQTDVATMCDWYIKLIADSNYLDRLCHQMALSTVQLGGVNFASDDALRSACTNAESACGTKLGERMTDIRQNCISSIDTMTCTAKVSDFENCAIALTETPTTEFPSCNSLTVNTKLPTTSTILKEPPECDTFNSLCSDSTEDD